MLLVIRLSLVSMIGIVLEDLLEVAVSYSFIQNQSAIINFEAFISLTNDRIYYKMSKINTDFS